jgi:hypothetical protein
MKLKGLLGTIAVLILASSTFAQHKAPPPFASPKDVPFYIPPGVIQTSDPVKQRQEYVRYLIATNACYQGSKDTFQSMMPGSDSISIETKLVSTSSVTNPNTNMKLVLDHYIKMPDGSVRVTSLCNQQLITQAQVDVVVKDLIAVTAQAAQDDYDFYNVIYDKAIAARATKLGISVADLKAQLDEKVPGYDITFRELHRLPKPMRVSDFVPRELHLGYNIPLQGILGVTWLNTGLIYYNPDARIVDWLDGRPKVMSHEMVHNNINIEKFPMSEAFDVELMASLPEMLYEENHLDFATHGYAKDIRELAQIYYGFDFAQMNKDVFKVDLAGNTVIDEERFRFYADQLTTIRKEFMTFFQNVTIPEFYSDPSWWAAVNDIRGDNNSVFRVTMALYYNPTILGGSKETLQWLESHREEIMEIGNSAFQIGLGRAHGGTMPAKKFGNIPSYLIAEYERVFTPVEREHIEAYYKQHPDQLTALLKMTPQAAVQELLKFKTQSMGVTVQ